MANKEVVSATNQLKLLASDGKRLLRKCVKSGFTLAKIMNYLFKMQENGHKKHRVKQQKTPFLCGLCTVFKTSVTNCQRQHADT